MALTMQMKFLLVLVTILVTLTEAASSLCGQQHTAHPFYDTIRPGDEAWIGLRRELKNYGIACTPSALIEGLNHKESMARTACLRGLGIAGDLSAVDHIRRLLEDPEFLVRETALRALHSIVSRELMSQVEQLYRDSRYKNKDFELAVLVCEFGDPGRYAWVLKAIQNPGDPLLGRALMYAPMFARYRLYENGQPVDWVRPISRVLADRRLDPMLRQSAATALKDIGSPEAFDVMKDTLPMETDPTVKYILEGALRKK